MDRKCNRDRTEKTETRSMKVSLAGELVAGTGAWASRLCSKIVHFRVILFANTLFIQIQQLRSMRE